jgi:hypothetical protein
LRHGTELLIRFGGEQYWQALRSFGAKTAKIKLGASGGLLGVELPQEQLADVDRHHRFRCPQLCDPLTYAPTACFIRARAFRKATTLGV